MKRLIISDFHLGKRFNKNKSNYLTELFYKYDEIILNGDFWDYYLTSFEDFVNSEWKKLFPIMKNKTIYLYGNHDRKEWNDDSVNLFSKKQSQKYKFKSGRFKYIIQHGHDIDSSKKSENYPFAKIGRLAGINSLGLLVDDLISKTKKDKYKKIEEYAKNMEKEKFLITGHKHIPIINKEKRYAVTGSVMYGRSSYLEMNNKGELKIIEETY